MSEYQAIKSEAALQTANLALLAAQWENWNSSLDACACLFSIFILERSVILCTGDSLIVEDALAYSKVSRRPDEISLKHELETVERSSILRTLEESDWKVKGEATPRVPVYWPVRPPQSACDEFGPHLASECVSIFQHHSKNNA